MQIIQIGFGIIFIILLSFTNLVIYFWLSRSKSYIKKYYAFIFKPVDQYISELPEFDIICGHFDTKKEAMDSARNHLEIFLLANLKSGKPFPVPKEPKSENYYPITVNLKKFKNYLTNMNYGESHFEQE